MTPGSPSRNLRYPLARLIALGVVLLGSLGYLLVLALEGANLVHVRLGTSNVSVSSHNPRVWLIIAVVAAAVILAEAVAAARGASSLKAALADVRDARQGEEEARRSAREAESQRDALRRELQQERADRQRIVAAWRSEREWNRELREQIVRLQRSHGLVGRHDDVREMVLELTMGLVEAEKGILLSQNETTADGQLEVVCHLGFEHDPQQSAIAQRFATEVMERDTTLREDDSSRLGGEEQTAADAEVQSLLAIPIYLLDDFSGVIICANREGGFGDLDEEVLVAVGNHAGAVLQNSRLHGDLRNAYLSTIGVLADAIELKDPELRGHSDAVSGYVMAVADRLDLEPSRREQLIFASLLHDVGKLGISERILLKPASLTDEERSIIELHPRIGYHLVRQVPALSDIAPAVLHHHERFDGSGYPGHLRGESIPLEARIIAVADTFSAITSDRPYSHARSVEEACAELERCAGEQFDPEVVRLFVEEVRRHPPTGQEPEPLTAEPELALHREDGEFKLGARSFGITDSLTMLYSHRHFHETCRAEVQRAAMQSRPFSVVAICFDGLDEINRAHGFAAGDRALQAAATATQQMAVSYSGHAFRVSGRRLAIVAPSVDGAAEERTVAAIASALRSLPEISVDLRPGVGVATWREGDSAEQLVERAWRASAGSTPSAPSVSYDL